MANFNFGTGVGDALGSFQAPSANYTPQKLGFLDQLKAGASNAFSQENVGSTGYALNTLGKIFGADPSISGPVGEFAQSTVANQDANKQKEGQNEQGDLFKQILLRMAGGGGNFSAENAGGSTGLKVGPGKDGNIVGTLTGDITTKDANADMATATDLTSGSESASQNNTLRDLLPF